MQVLTPFRQEGQQAKITLTKASDLFKLSLNLFSAKKKTSKTKVYYTLTPLEKLKEVHSLFNLLSQCAGCKHFGARE